VKRATKQGGVRREGKNDCEQKATRTYVDGDAILRLGLEAVLHGVARVAAEEAVVTAVEGGRVLRHEARDAEAAIEALRHVGHAAKEALLEFFLSHGFYTNENHNTAFKSKELLLLDNTRPRHHHSHTRDHTQSSLHNSQNKVKEEIGLSQNISNVVSSPLTPQPSR
jgi:hypothetical protein